MGGHSGPGVIHRRLPHTVGPDSSCSDDLHPAAGHPLPPGSEVLHRRARCGRGKSMSTPMNFELTDEQRAIRDLARRFAREEVAPRARRIDEKAQFDWELHARLGELGFLAMTAPEAYGGSGADTLTWCLVVEEIAKASSAVANGLTLTESMVHYLIMLGSEEQKGTHIPPLARGEKICSFCLTEPNAGSDAASVQTIVVDEGASYVINGEKTFISGALLADCFVVVATVDRKQRSKGVRAFLVDKDTPGLTVGRKFDLLGI